VRLLFDAVVDAVVDMHEEAMDVSGLKALDKPHAVCVANRHFLC
jgi:hypothetical protein